MSAHFTPPEQERGAALLAVLLLVAVMGALAAGAFGKLRLSTALAANNAGLDQARAYASGIEQLLALKVDDITARGPERTTLAGGWNGSTKRLPLPGGGVAEAAVRDGGNCFNINSLVAGDVQTSLVPRAAGIAQFTALMEMLGVPEANARSIAAAGADWADSNSAPLPGGAEDSDYARAGRPYRTGNTMFADVSELRAVAGMTPEVYAAIRPWLCALPTADLSPINPNTLSPDQAPLLAMLAPDRIGIETARGVLARRPEQGWGSITDFWRAPGLGNVAVPLDVRMQPQLRTRWFALDLRIDLQGTELVERALVDARFAPARVAMRRWGIEE